MTLSKAVLVGLQDSRKQRACKGLDCSAQHLHSVSCGVSATLNLDGQCHQVSQTQSKHLLLGIVDFTSGICYAALL